VFVTYDCRSGPVPNWVHPVAIGRHSLGVMPAAAQRSIGIIIDAATREATVRGHQVALTNQEFELLRVLVSSAGTVWSRERLIESAWKHDSYVTVGTVDVVVAALRRKIERDAHDPEVILGAATAGYKIRETE
jgi:DNA-binding response OmpR family regulator